MEARTPKNHDCMETVDRSSASAAVDVPSSNSPDRQSGNPLKSPQKERTKALNMAKKSMHKAKRCAKEAQKTTALEALLQNLAKAQEEAIAPQRKKARATKEEQPQTAEAEAAAELEGGQDEVDQMRDTDKASTVAALPTRLVQSGTAEGLIPSQTKTQNTAITPQIDPTPVQ